jgi:caffeoyl-CoA O-methyltransferase
MAVVRYSTRSGTRNCPKRHARYLAELNLDHLVHYRVSEAVAALKETDGPFDLIFNDINKEGYPDSLPVIEPSCAPAGC